MEKDFNNIKVWLENKLYERGLSTSKMTRLTGYKISNASVFRWYNDTFRPTAEKMDIVCRTLSALPLTHVGGPPVYEEVHLADALRQFSERPYKGRSR